LLGYVEGKQTLSVFSSGNGGAAELVQKLDDAQVLYGLVRVADVIDGNATTKFVLVQWVGSGVKTLVKARVSTHSPFIKTLLKHHVYVSAEDKSEISEQTIRDKVSDASGSGNRVLTEGRRIVSAQTSMAVTGKRKSFAQASAELKFVNADAIKAVLSEVRNSSSSTDYVLLGYEGETDDLSLVSSGSGGLPSVIEKLSPDVVLYGLFRLTEKIDNLTTAKLVLLTWIGEQVKVIRKARITTHIGGVQNLVGQFHVAVTSSDKAELTEASLKEKINEGSGSRTREATSPRPGGATNTAGTSNKPPGTGFVRRMTETNPMSRKPSGSNLVPGSASAISIPDEKGVKDAIDSVRKGPDNWVLLGYESATTIVLRGKGAGGVSELVSHLSDDKVLYGLVRKEEELDGHKHTKFAQIFWCGDKVQYVAKAKVTPHKGELNTILAPFHADIYATSTSELTEESISAKLKTA